MTLLILHLIILKSFRDIHLVKASVDDLKILNTINIQSKQYWDYPTEWLEHWKDDLNISSDYVFNNQVYLLKKGNESIGFCAIEERPEEYEVGQMWVLPEYIGKGYGKFLLENVLARVIKDKKDIIVIADPNAEPFYQKMGFVTIDHKESYPKGRFIPIMKKSL